MQTAGTQFTAARTAHRSICTGRLTARRSASLPLRAIVLACILPTTTASVDCWRAVSRSSGASRPMSNAAGAHRWLRRAWATTPARPRRASVHRARHAGVVSIASYRCQRELAYAALEPRSGPQLHVRRPHGPVTTTINHNGVVAFRVEPAGRHAGVHPPK